MTVYELLIDWNGTTRSHYSSEGLFTTSEKAQNYYFHLKKKGGIYGGYEIKRRVVM